jgi:hypothetical protein
VEDIDDSEVELMLEVKVDKQDNATEKQNGLLDSEVQLVKETENKRELNAIQRSIDSDSTETTQDIFQEHSIAQVESDTTASTPDILKSPDVDSVVSMQNEVEKNCLDAMTNVGIEAKESRRKTALNRQFKGVRIPEAQFLESESDSEDGNSSSSLALFLTVF